MRIHPAVLAHATATTAQLLDGRFVWGVGTGAAFNEHVLGDRWPPAPERLEMLEEAVEVVRALWTGEQVTHRVENARLFDPPPSPVPIVVSAFGPKAAEVAARIGDGLWVTGSDADTVQSWHDAGGSGPVYAQLTVSWSRDREHAIDVAHRMWPNTGIPGQLSQDLPTPVHFEQAVQLVTREQITSSVSCRDDPAPIIEAIDAAADAGVDHLYQHQIGDDQDALCEAWSERIRPSVAG